jgi:cytochrome c oxidase subunit 2
MARQAQRAGRLHVDNSGERVMRHFVIVGVLIIPLSILTYIGIQASHLMPVEASAQSVIVDQVWNWDMMTLSFLFALIIVPLVYSLVVFRRRKGETGEGKHEEGDQRLEIAWTIIPLMIVTAYAYMGAYTLGETRLADPNALAVNVTAHQWDWAFDYPEGFTSNELHLPINKQVVLKMTSLDVIHSFWVPEFRIKQDVVPGRITELRITPVRLGSYTVYCAELCGTSHAYMKRPVIVTSQEEYAVWVKEQAAAQQALLAKGGPEAGKAMVAQNGCSGCHSIDGSKLTGPTWRGLFGSQVKLENGQTVAADEAYLTEAIKDPNAKIVAGFPAGIMPHFNLTDQQIKSIVQYIETLK